MRRPTVLRRRWVFGAAALHLLALACVPLPAIVGSSPPPSGGGTGASVAPGELVDAPGACGVAANVALQQIGEPYVWGAKGPNSFDCSGLVHYSYKAAGLEVGMGTDAQSRSGAPIPCTLADLNGAATTCWQTGDLVFLRGLPGAGQHVAMYITAGHFADCYNSGTGCIYHSIAGSTTYESYWWQARRIANCVLDVATGQGEGRP